MRIENDITSDGFFWLPGSEDKKIPGTLYIKEDDKIHVELKDLFEQDAPDNINFELIHGYVEQLGYVSLEKCFYTRQERTFGKITPGNATLLVNFLYAGNVTINSNELELDSITFRCDYLDEWVGISGINVEHQPIKSNKANAIYYKKPDSIKLELGDGFSLEIDFSYTLPGFPNLTEAKFTQKVFLKLSSTKPLKLSDFDTLAHKILRFIALCIGIPLVISDLTGKISGEDHYIKIFYKSFGHVKKKTVHIHDMNFPYNNIKIEFQDLLIKWIDLHDILMPSIELYFQSFTGENTLHDARFISLVQGLETFHRRTSDEKYIDQESFEKLVDSILKACPEEHIKWLSGRTMHGNEVSLNTRLVSLIMPFSEHIGSKRLVDKLARKISSTRNYKTHYDPAAEKSAVNGIALYKLILFMECILLLNFMKKIDFPEDKLIRLFNNSFGQFKRNFKYSLSN